MDIPELVFKICSALDIRVSFGVKCAVWEECVIVC